MNTTTLTQHITPIYLTLILIIQSPHTPTHTILIILPLTIILLAINKKNTTLGLIGFALYTILAIPTTLIGTLENITTITITLLLILLPTLLMLSHILQLNNNKTLWLIHTKTKPLLLTTLLLLTIILTTYILSILFWEGILLSPENIPGQLILLTAISLACTIPMLIK